MEVPRKRYRILSARSAPVGPGKNGPVGQDTRDFDSVAQAMAWRDRMETVKNLDTGKEYPFGDPKRTERKDILGAAVSVCDDLKWSCATGRIELWVGRDPMYLVVRPPKPERPDRIRALQQALSSAAPVELELTPQDGGALTFLLPSPGTRGVTVRKYSASIWAEDFRDVGAPADGGDDAPG